MTLKEQHKEQVAARKAERLARIQAIVDHYVEGHTMVETGKQFGISHERVRQLLVREGITDRHGCNPSARKAKLYHLKSVAPDVVKDYNAGVDLDEIKKEYALSRDELAAIVQSHVSKLEQRKRLSATHKGKHRKFSNDDLVKHLQAAHRMFPDYLSAAKYEEYRTTVSGAPSSQAMVMRFGSWGEAIEQIGLKVAERPAGFGARSYFDWEMLDAILRVADIVGRPPTLPDYREHRQSHEPGGDIIRVRFGTWMQALDIAMEIT